MPDSLSFEQLTPEEQAAVQARGLAPSSAPSNDPVDLTDNARDLAEFYKKAPPANSLNAWMADPKNVERMKTDPTIKQKVEDAHRILEDETTFWKKGAALAKQAVTHPGETALGIAKMGGGLLLHGAADVAQGEGPVVKALRSVGINAPSTLDIAAKVLPKGAQEQVKRLKDTLKVEAMAGHEAAGVGIAAMAKGAAENVKEFFLRGAEETESSIAALLAGSGDEEAMREAASTDLRIDADRQRRSNERLWGKAALAEQEREIMAGQGPVTKALTGGATEDFSPGRAEWLAAGSPVGLAGFEAGVGALRGVTKLVLQQPLRAGIRGARAAETAAAVENAAQQSTARAAGSAAEVAGKAIEAGRETLPLRDLVAAEGVQAEALSVQKSAQALADASMAKQMAAGERVALLREELARKSIADYILGEGVAQGIAEGAAGVVAPVASAVKGAALGTAAAAVGAAAGTAEVLGKGALLVAPKGLTPQLASLGVKFAEGVRKRGLNVAKGYLAGDTAVLGPKSRALYDVVGAAGQGLTGAAKGFALLDLPLAIAVSQTPDEAAQSPLFGTAFGLAGGALRGGKQFVRGQEIDQRNWGVPTKPYKEYGKKGVSSAEANYDQATSLRMQDATLDADPETHQKKVNAFLAIRELVDSAGGEAYWLSDENFRQMQERFKDQGADAQPNAPGLIVNVGKKPVVFVRDPGVAPHESTHVIQRIAGEEAMDRFYEQLYGVYAPYWESLGIQMAMDYGAPKERAVANWQTALLDALKQSYPSDPAKISEKANRVLGSELHAEILDTVVKHDGASLIKQGEGRPWYSMDKILANAASLLAGLYESLGQEPYGETFSGTEKTSRQGLPVLREAAEMVRGQAREHLRTQALPGEVQILPKGAKPTPAPAGTAPTAPPAEVKKKAEDWLDKQPDSPKKEAGKAITEAVGTGGVRVRYRHVPGKAEAGSALTTEAMREARRKAIEEGRDLPEGERVPIEEDFFPQGVEMTSKGPQWVGFRGGVIEANWTKFADWIGKVRASAEAAGLKIPYEPTDAGRAEMLADLESYGANQGAGLTGGGEKLGAVTRPGFFQPEAKGPAGTPLSPEKVAFLNYLVHAKIAGEPGKAPVIRSRAKVPIGVAGQELRAATLGVPVESLPVVRPKYGDASGKGTREAAADLGISDVALREVNPFREIVDKVAKDTGVPAPDMIEAATRLNFEHIDEVLGKSTATPGVGKLNTLTLAAGFAAPKPGVEAIRAAMIVDEKTGKKYTGMMHPWIREQIAEEYLRGKLAPGRSVSEVMDASIADKANMALKREALEFASDQVRFKEGYYTTEGRFLDRRQSMPVAREAGQLRREVEKGRDWLDSDDLNVEASFASPKELRDMDMAKLQELRTYTTTAKHGTGGPTGLAYDIGLATKTPEGLRELAENMREQRQIYADKLAKIKSGEIDPETGFDDLQPSSTKGQLFREAAEAATGSGSAGQYLRKKGYTDADFPMLGASFAAKTETGKAKEAEGFEFRHTGEKGIRGVVVLKDGSPVGEIISHVPQSRAEGAFKGDEVWVDAVEVNKAFRGQDLGKALYRELLTTLKEDGHTKVLGMVVAPEPLAIREKIMGPGNTKYRVNGKPVSLDDAIAAAYGYKFEGRDENGNWITPSIEAESTITPDAQFAAPKKPTMSDLEKRLRELEDEMVAERKRQAKPVRVAKEFQTAGGKKESAKTKWSLKQGAEGFSKAWILPNGEPMQLGGKWHHEGLKEVADKYGIEVPDFKGNDAYGVREAALKKGFARVAYDINGGRLGIELRAADFRKLRPSIEKFIEDNLDKIDKLDITLFDREANDIVDDSMEQLFKLGASEKLPTALEMLDNLRTREGASFAAPKRGDEQPELFKSGGYPEAVRVGEGELVEYGIKDSPLAKAAGDEKAAINAYADKMVEEARQLAKHPVLKHIWNQGITWYRRFVPMVKKEFGKDAPLFTQLLAGTSPRTSASVNFGFAYDAYLSLKDGRFDPQIKKFLEGYEMLKDGSWKDTVPPETTAAGFMADWIEKHDLKPRQSNGKLYGTHSARVLQVLAGVWKQQNEGPKTDNFDKNLLGTGHEATIDMWAARTLRRLGYEGAKKRWRILPENETGVSDEDFYFSQAVFREAAKRLKARPDDLQGAFWLTEKQLWSDKHWADLDLGDFAKEMEELETRQVEYRENMGQGPQTSFNLTTPKVEGRLKP